MADKELNQDVVVEFEEDIDPTEPILQDDGSALIPELEEPQDEMEFYANLAETLPESELTRLATELQDLVEKDIESRKKRDEQYEEGLRRTGLGDDAPGGAQFEGASRVVHPVMAEACVDFASAAIKELFPPDGPVKTKSLGQLAPDQRERAFRKKAYMNWQLTEQMPEYRSELEVLLTQIPLGGSQYLKIWYDEANGRPSVEFTPIDDVYLPFSATSFYTSPRVTHHLRLTRHEFDRRINAGTYREITVIDPGMTPEQSASETANDKIEGRAESAYNEDGLRDLYEIHTYQSVGDALIGDDREAPYVITIDVYSNKVVGLYRNWEENDEKLEKLDWFVEWKFIPWRGAYGIGLPHLIGGLAAGATGAIRALLDSAHIATMPGAFMLKGGRVVGQSKSYDPTEVTQLEGPANIDDIRKLIMPPPFAGPSPVLFQLLGWLTEAAKGVVSTAEEKIAEASNQMPVGTTLALIEQGSKVFSAIHARLHEAQKRALQIIARLNRQYMDDAAQVQDIGKPLASREDFIGSLDVIPVSDPNIFSEAQRFAQIQGVLQMTADKTVAWNMPAIYRRVLSQMHVDNIDEILPPPPVPVTADAVSENYAAMSGQQIMAHPEQDHLSQIRVHLAFIVDPLFGASPMVGGPGLQMIFDHAVQHLLMLYPQMMQQAMQLASQMVVLQAQQAMVASGIDPSRMPPPQVPHEQLQVMALQMFEQAKQHLAPLQPLFAQAMEIVKAKAPPPPMDPQSQVALQIAQGQQQMDLQATQARHAMQMQIEQAKDARENARMQAELELKSRELELKQLEATQITPALQRITSEVEIIKNMQDNNRAREVELLKNRDDNETQIIIAQLKQELGDMRNAQAQQPDVIPQIQQVIQQAQQAEQGQALAAMVQGLQTVVASINRPKQVLRDEQGDIVGVQ